MPAFFAEDPAGPFAPMSAQELHCAGVSHKTCPVEVRERLAALGAGAALEALAAEGLHEAVVLSTCNRFEAFVRAPAAEPRLRRFLERSAGARAGVYCLRGPEASAHIFEVAAGLDSMVLGETEILGQIKNAYEAAHAAGATGKLLNVLFQRALFVGKSVRARTHISAGHMSVSSVAVELARRIFGELGPSRVLILGAGDIAEKTARHFLAAGVRRLTILNRTWEKAEQLARDLGGGSSPARWEELPLRLAEADIVLASTGAPSAILDRPGVSRALSGRGGRPLFLIDMAMPRDVSDDVRALPGARLYTLDDFTGIVEENLEGRRRETEAARRIVLYESRAFAQWLGSLERGREISLRHSLCPVPLAAS